MRKKLTAFALSFIMLFSLSVPTVSAATDDYSDSIFYAANIAVNQNISGRINFGGDSDFFKFIAPITGTYTIYTSGDLDTRGYLYNSNGVQVDYNDDSDYDSNFLIERSCQAGEIYYVRVCHYNNIETGDYTLKVTAPNYSSTDDHGDTHATASYVLPFTNIKGRINYANDYDFFKFQAPTTGTYTIYTEGTTDTYGIVSGWGENDDGGNGVNFSMTGTLTQGQWYYVIIKGFSNTDIGNYTLHIDYTP